MACSMPGLSVHHQLLELAQISTESVMPSNHLILCQPLLLSPSIFPSIRVFSNESALRIRQPNYWSFSFSISPSNEYSGLISFRIDSFDLPAVQGDSQESSPNHSSKASVFQHSASFIVQLSHPYMTTGETIALSRWPFVGKAMCLLFNMLSRLASRVAQLVKNLPAMQETWVRSLGREVPLEKEMATHSCILAWRIQGQRSLVRHD